FHVTGVQTCALPISDKQQPSAEQSIEPYFVLMQLPGEKQGVEFVEILPFTPSNRNNMIGWIAGRCDGDAYGSLLAYNFPKSRLRSEEHTSELQSREN